MARGTADGVGLERFGDGPVVVFTWRNEPGWPVEYVSPNVERLFGYAPAELYAESPPYAGLIHDDDLDRVLEEVERHSDSGAERLRHEPYRMVTKDGDVRWVLDYTRIVREGGEITRYTGYIVDVTERRNQSVRLERAEEIGEFGSWKWNFDTGDVWWSDRIYDVLDRSKAAGPLDDAGIAALAHPEDRPRVEAAFGAALDRGADYDIEFRVDVDGRVRWVRSVAEVTVGPDGEPVAATGVFKDITDRKERERELKTLNGVAGDLLAAGPEAEIARTALRRGAELLSAAPIGRYDRTGERLTATDGAADVPLPPAVRDALDPAEPRVVGAAGGEGTTMLVVPLSDHGALVFERAAGFDADAVEIAGLLGSTTAAALDRAERTRSLEARTAELRRRAEQLKHLESLNAVIRSLHGVLIDADSRSAIADDVCASLAEFEGFDGVWIGSIDPDRGAVTPDAAAGIDAGDIDEGALSLETGAPAPAVRVVEARAPIEARGDDGRPVLAVPIRHREVCHGVLTVRGADADSFEGRVPEVLEELGLLVGYAITAVERRDALHGEGSRELVFEVEPDSGDPLRALSSSLSTRIEVRSVTRRRDAGPVLYCLLPDADPGAVPESFEGIESIQPLSDAESPVYEVVTADESVASSVIRLGARLRSMSVAERRCELVVSVRRQRDLRRFLRQVEELFGAAELRAEREATPTEPTRWPALLGDALTDRQIEALRTAYHAGYFDRKRKRSATEIAETLGVSQPTFSAHLRAAQRNLLAAVWGDG